MDAGNLGNIFLIIIPALCKEKGSPFGAPDVCQTYGLAYSSLSLAVRIITFSVFQYFVHILEACCVCSSRKIMHRLCFIFLQIGAIVLWTGAYNIIRANSEVTEGDGKPPTAQTKVSAPGGTPGVVSETNYSILSDHVDDCSLPLISNATTIKTKVFLFFAKKERNLDKSYSSL
jgi:hypothetical protein